MENFKKNRVILFIVFLLLVLLSLFIYNYRYGSNDSEVIVNDNKVKLLNDYNRFFTVNSSVYKYISYLQNKDIDNILKVLNVDYVNNNSINSSNVFNYVESLDGIYSFKARKIYYEELNSQYVKYYVYGELIKETMDSYGEKSDRYYVLVFDIDNQLFDLTPFDSVGFEEVTNG